MLGYLEQRYDFLHTGNDIDLGSIGHVILGSLALSARWGLFTNCPKINMSFIFGGVPNHSVYSRRPVREFLAQLYLKAAWRMPSSQKPRGSYYCLMLCEQP